MKTKLLLLCAASLVVALTRAQAATLYVDAASTNAVPPFTNWTTAAAVIQDAVDAAAPGDEIVVTNGVYQTGARAVAGMSNRVAVTKLVTVRSVNGPAYTSIVGYGPVGENAIRCAYLTIGAVLSGFTLTNGATQDSGDRYTAQSGGGVWCEGPSAVASNCVLAGNSAAQYGGGAYQSTLNSCTLTGNTSGYDGGGAAFGMLNKCVLTGNSAYHGGGAWYGTLNNCTFTSNSAEFGAGANYSTLNNCSFTGNSAYQLGGGAMYGTLKNCTLTGNSAGTGGAGAFYSTLNNCIVYYNTVRSISANYDGYSTFNYSCTTPLPDSGTGNLAEEPQLASSFRLSPGSPCIRRGSAAYASGVDLDGETWANPPSIGCDEYWSGSVTGALSLAVVAAYTNVGVGVAVDFLAVIEGRLSASRWDFADGVVVSNRPWASHAWAALGDYVVELRAYNESEPAGVEATVTVHVVHQEHYVALNNGNPVPPYTNWATAATNIQDALDAVALPGALVWVSNGVYQTGARAVDGMNNRVAVTKPAKVQSVNGPAVTSIVGSGLEAVRCVYLANGAMLAGFTLTNGAQSSGGGVYCVGPSAVASNCVLTGNSADYGGGVYYGTLKNCTLTGNTAYAGGGAYSSTLNNCTLTGNSASYGGGASYGPLNNCTLTRNSADFGGGAYGCALNNCIVYYNSARSGGANYSGESTLNYSCTTRLPTSGTGNLAEEPQLASRSHLSAGSPCIDRGSATYASGVDLDGEPWANPPSIGCDEYRSGSVTGALSVVVVAAYTNVGVGFAVDFQAVIGGRVSASRWDFGDGVVVSNRPWASHAWAALGDYVVALRAYNESEPAGVTATVTVQVVPQQIYFVALDNASPVPPYTNWATAATNIQDALDVAGPGALVWVSNGVYATGGRAFNGTSLTNRVCLDRAVTLRSVNGPGSTLINGMGNGRCAYLTSGAVLTGFTLTNGVAQIDGGLYEDQCGGGAWCEGLGAVMSNCVVAGCSASWTGGGACFGTLNNCTLTGNSATYGGGAEGSALNDCMVTGNSAATGGGGTHVSTLTNCTLIGNYADSFGGGASDSTLDNCVLTNNSVYDSGGGAYASTLNNCTVTGNGGDFGGGASECALNNCTLTGNRAFYGGGANSCRLTNCTLMGNAADSAWSSQTSGGGAYGSTLENCALQGNWADSGGGARDCTLNNCVLTGNGTGEGGGGGALWSTLINCTLTGNHSSAGGGATGCTLTNCILSGNSAYEDGGGAYESTLYNCTLTGNWGSDYGGGAFVCTLYNCTLTGNQASYYGGGASRCTLNNCTVTGNSAGRDDGGGGGGVSDSTLNNCIVYYNTSYTTGANYLGGTFNYSCTTPQPADGAGNISTEPQLAGTSHLGAASPCRGAGSAVYTRGLDLDGEPWANPPSIGCDEYWSGSVTGALSVAFVATYTSVVPGFAVDFQAVIGGRASASRWDLGDGLVVSNRLSVSHAWAALGDYVVELRAYNETYPSGVATSVVVRVVEGRHYVSVTSTNPVSPYTNWATAATRIQDAVDVAVPGARVLVSDGVYQAGTTSVGDGVNRVAVLRPVTVQSVHGPGTTIIDGTAEMRCVYLANGAVLAGFTLTNGAAQWGGGVWCESATTVVSNCTLVVNSVSYYGGGAYSGLLNNCTLTGNSAQSGGGAYSSTLNNCTLTRNSAAGAYAYGGGAYEATLNHCTLTGNSAQYGGGAYGSTLDNCIVYYNSAPNGPNYYFSTINYSCTTPPPGGTGNISADPQLAGNWHLSATSPCRGTGNAASTSGVDLDGEPWANPPSIGSDEYSSGSAAGALSVAIVPAHTNLAVGYAVDFLAVIGGWVNASRWDFGDGGMEVSNRLLASHAWATPGDYVVELRAYNESYPMGVAASVMVRVVDPPVHYVSVISTNPVPPYTNWATAATRIQDAVDAATLPGARILVTNGVYQSGATAVDGMSNRLVVTKPVTVQSVNGPAYTSIVGSGPRGASAIRCVYLAGSAMLSGFTLANGATLSFGDWIKGESGGGAWCESASAVLSNCTLTGNSASFVGGGAYGGTLNHCVVTGNSATYGGGVHSGTLNNCKVVGNAASYYGGGTHSCTLNHCTLTGNRTEVGGGAAYSTFNNCIVYYNSPNYYGCTFNYSCTTPLPDGPGNIASEPFFVNANGWSNLRLQSNSPCINAGNNASVATSTDLDGFPRIAGGTVDIGAYEFQSPASTISFAWLQQFGLPTDGSADDVDTDHDGHNNWQEWMAGTDPTNSLSVLRLASPVLTPTNVTLTWTSVTNRTYTLEQATNLGGAPAFSVLRSNLVGLPNTTSWTDTNAPVSSPRFYQLRVSP